VPVWLYWMMAAGAVVLCAGYACEKLQERRDRKRYLPPGKLVDVGRGRRMHLFCQGNAAGPTIVIEQGAASPSLVWWPVREVSASRKPSSTATARKTSAELSGSPVSATYYRVLSSGRVFQPTFSALGLSGTSSHRPNEIMLARPAKRYLNRQRSDPLGITWSERPQPSAKIYRRSRGLCASDD
jgi:hypothetical protein